jgi:cellulose synthase/poly-beta-1,6-N-acetylglucosamine synthase-like glycosyltransferase
LTSGGEDHTCASRPKALGKSIYLGGQKLYIRGVTYGTFRPDEASEAEFPDRESVSADFAGMAENGVNAVRTYTIPPRWLLDLAAEHRLWVMAGLPWEQHITFLDEPGRAASIERQVRAGVRAVAGHPALLCLAIGNEVPASIVRWHGRQRVERFLKRLYEAAKDEDPEALVTYVNYPSTEYLHLPFLDVCCFNVFLEAGQAFESYLWRLQNIAGDRPLVLTETGLDSLRNSEEAQARALDWQVRTAFASGCAGTFVFSWTDEWYRGGFDIEDWAFGLVDRGRAPKPALATVGRAFSEAPFRPDPDWPRVSVVVCAYNSESTLRECLDHLKALDYPDYEVIVVNDGSTDGTEEIVLQRGFRLISTHNKGLACARNSGLEASSGEIVAYIDADAYPDPHWLSHLAHCFLRADHAGIGGPNIPPPGDGDIAESVANAPGGPIHVLLSDEIAEHIPGCNMAFWKHRLEEIGGFDSQFRIAGDDVDICWRLQDRGWTVGFSPGAVVWHHRRGSVRNYVKQQFEYGKAEALLERKWPERYNRAGHLAWAGRVYANSSTRSLERRRWKIYYGTWGTGLFQSVYAPAPGVFRSLPLMPEWYLVIAALSFISLLGVVWSPLLLALPLLVLAVVALVAESMAGAATASFSERKSSRLARLRRKALVTMLFMVQPAARLGGRLRRGLAPWRRSASPRLVLPFPRTRSLWSEHWSAPDERLRGVDAAIRRHNGVVISGGDFERWDLHVRGGLLGSMRMRMAVEEHGAGRQQMRFRYWPRFSRLGLAGSTLFAALATWAAIEQSWLVAAILAGGALLLMISMLHDCAAAGGIVMHALDDQDEYAPARLPRQLGALEPVLLQNGSVANGARADHNGAHPVPNGHADVNGAIQPGDTQLDVAPQKEG